MTTLRKGIFRLKSCLMMRYIEFGSNPLGRVAGAIWWSHLKTEPERNLCWGKKKWPAATILETHTRKFCSNRPQGLVLVSDCFLIYPFQLETNRREYVPLSNPVGAPVPVSLQRPYITSSQQDMPFCFATTPMRTPSLSLMQVVLADPSQCK